MEQKRLKEFGPWSEQTSSSGKRYYYNRETEISQWEKPPEWREYERALIDSSVPQTSSTIGSIRNNPVSRTNNSSNANNAKPSRFERDDRDRKNKDETPQANQTAQETKNGAAQAPTRLDQAAAQKAHDDELRKYAKYARPELVNHLKGWKGDYYAAEAKKLHQNANNLTAQINAIDADIKTVQSLVYIAETKSNLLARKKLFVKQQLESLESSIMNVPSLNT